MSESSVAETLYVMMNKDSTEVEEKDTADNVVDTTEKDKETKQEGATEEKSETTTPAEACSENQSETTSEDPYCVDKDCKCHSKEESSDVETKEESSDADSKEEELVVESEDSEEDSAEELEKIRYEPIRVYTQFQYFPPEVNALAIVVLFLHLLNAFLQLTDKNKIECFKRPY